MANLTYHGRHCKRCGTVERYEKNNRCVACNKQRNKSRKKEERAESYAKNRPLFKGDAFEIAAIKRAGTVECLGTKEEQLLVQQYKEYIKEINGKGLGAEALWGLDHYVPLVGAVSNNQRIVGRHTLDNLFIVEVAENRKKKNKMPEHYTESQFNLVDLDKIRSFKTAAEVREAVMKEKNYKLNTPIKMNNAMNVSDALEEMAEQEFKAQYEIPNVKPHSKISVYLETFGFLVHKATTQPYLLGQAKVDAILAHLTNDGYEYGIGGIKPIYHDSFIEDIQFLQSGRLDEYWNKRNKRMIEQNKNEMNLRYVA